MSSLPSEPGLPPVGSKERHALRARERHRRRGYGTLGPYDFVPVYAARHVVKTLRDAGFTFDRIAEITGIDTRQLCKILRPETLRVKKHTHDQFASIDIDEVMLTEPRSHKRLPQRPYRDLLRSYLAAGWSRDELIAIAGPPLHKESNVWRDRGKYVSIELAQAIDKMHAELGERVKNPEELGDRDKARITVMRSRGYDVPASYDRRLDGRNRGLGGV